MTCVSFHSIWKINQAEETVDSVVENFQTMNKQFPNWNNSWGKIDGELNIIFVFEFGNSSHTGKQSKISRRNLFVFFGEIFCKQFIFNYSAFLCCIHLNVFKFVFCSIISCTVMYFVWLRRLKGKNFSQIFTLSSSSLWEYIIVLIVLCIWKWNILLFKIFSRDLLCSL